MKKDFGIIFWLHSIFILSAILSPFWLDWRLITVGIIFLQLQYFFAGGCILTHMEMGKDKEMTFWYYYLAKIFPNLNKRKVKIFIRYYLFGIVFFTAVLLHFILHFRPALSF